MFLYKQHFLSRYAGAMIPPPPPTVELAPREYIREVRGRFFSPLKSINTAHRFGSRACRKTMTTNLFRRFKFKYRK